MKERQDDSGVKLAMMLVGGLASVTVLGAVDYATGVEIGFSIFYLAPIGVVAWFGAVEGAPVGVSATIGAVSFQSPPQSAEAAIRAADDRMYHGKRAGRDRLFLAGADLERPAGAPGKTGAR